MARTRPFSFLRLGDMELMFLISSPNQHAVSWQEMVASEVDLVSSTIAFGHPGLEPEHATRLQRAYECCSYLDFHDGWMANKQELPKWNCKRPANGHRNPGPGLAYARRRGVMEAAYEYIVFCDDDNWLAPDYLSIAREILFDPKVGAAGGQAEPEFEGPVPAFA
jgi:hypothetical protein